MPGTPWHILLAHVGRLGPADGKLRAEMPRARPTAWPSWMAAVGVLMAAPHLVGCSALFVTGPPSSSDPPPPLDRPLECTTSDAAPLVDTAIVGVQAVRVVYAAQAKDHEYRDFPINRTADLSIGASLLTLFTISALYGFSTTSECSKAKQRHAHKRRELSLQERTGSPPQPPSSPPH